jgi:predicted porin
MNKKLIPFAVAAALTVPFAAQAEVTIYGKANVSYDGVKCDGGDRHYKITSNSPDQCLTPIFDNGVLVGASDSSPVSRASRLGFKGSEDLGNGLKAIWKMEFAVDMANNNPVDSSRNAYVGLAGDVWGSFLLGRHDTPYKLSMAKLDYFSDQLADFNGTVGFEDLRAQNVAVYISPNWGGFTLTGAILSPGDDFDDGQSDVGQDWAEAYSIAGVYDNGGIHVGAAYERFDKSWAQLSGSFAEDLATGNLIPIENSGVAKDKWTIGGGWEGDAFGITGRWETRNDQAGVSGNDVDSWQIQGKFNFGNNTLKGMFGNTDPDWESDYNSWAVGWDYNFTRRSQLWAQWSDADDHWDGFALGMTHKF